MKFISEIASSHNGNIKNVIFLTKTHLQSKSDYIKYQIFKTENLYEKKEIEFKEYKKLEINYKSWEKVINKFKKKTNIILEPFDNESYNFCEKFSKNVSIKISTSETDNSHLIIKALKNFKKIFLNFSGYTIDEIKILLKKIHAKKYKKKLVLMYGFQSYPSKIENYRTNLFDYFKKKNFTFGFADHSIYGLSNDLITSLFVSINKKCSFFEKHVCKNIKEKPDDYIASIEFQDLKKLIFISNDYKKIIKKNNKNFHNREKNYAKNMHKKIFLTKKLEKGEKLNLNSVKFLRTKKNGFRRIDILGKNLYAKKLIKKDSFPTLQSFVKK